MINKPRFLVAILFCGISFFVFSCKKYSSDTQYGIANNQVNLINKALVIGSGGKIFEGDMPKSISNTISITDSPKAVQVSAGVLLFFNFGTSNNANLCKLYLQIDSADTYWEAPIQIDPVSTRPFIKLLIPNFVRNGNFKLNFSVEDCAGNISSVSNTELAVTDPLSCGSTFEGSIGITALTANLGNKAGLVTINYNMFTVKDRLDVRYKDKWILSTGNVLAENGYPNCNNYGLPNSGFVSGGNTVSFNYDPKESKFVEIYVTGCESGTRWNVTINCPQ
ncbi:MAG: hypothetical protein WCI53_12630 [Bacteroidota bacterium]|jgi:hypothetical protein